MSKFSKYFMLTGIAFAIIMASTMLTGCSSKVVPPGTVVIILKANGEASIYTEGSYLSYGRDRVYFVDTKLKSFTESMKILCVDNINMDVDVKWIGSFDVSKDNIKTIKEKVPSVPVKTGDVTGYKLSLDKFYKTAMRDIVRASTRSIVSQYTTDEVREKRSEIESKVKSLVLAKFKNLNYPIASTDVMISNLDYPVEVTEQRTAIKRAELEDQKQAALSKAAIAQAKREAAIAREKGKAQVEMAKADAAANLIRAKSLTPEIIKMRMWDVIGTVGGREGDLMIVPYDALGSILEPSLIGNMIDVDAPAE
jgi:regulator of protease activity HflC (stomatin/prohibitin superfamily)